MKSRKIIISVICILLVVLFVVSLIATAIPALAASSTDIKSEINALKDQKSEIQGRIDAIQVQIDDLDNQKQSTLEKKAILDEKNTLAQQELDVIEEQIAIIERYMANRQEDLEKARDKEQTQHDAWLGRLRAMEENSDMSYLQVIFEANSFSDLLTRIDTVTEISQHDKDLFSDYIDSRKNVETLEAEAEEMARLNEENLAELEQKKIQLQADIDAADAMIRELESTLEGFEELQAAEEADAAAVAAQIAEKQAEYDEAVAREQEAARLAALAAGVAIDGSAGNANFNGDGSTFLWPSYTGLITSYFGPRVSPGGIGSTNHKGVDIGASYGTAIWAAADGYVSQAGWNGGYGNCVTISHGNGYSTLYGHMSSVAVSAGQYVSQGQIIGYVGSTGNSTGPHIHFSVLQNGSFINPLAYNYIYA